MNKDKNKIVLNCTIKELTNVDSVMQRAMKTIKKAEEIQSEHPKMDIRFEIDLR